eukprot:300525-Prorocentrum_minimum.AAC.1
MSYCNLARTALLPEGAAVGLARDTRDIAARTLCTALSAHRSEQEAFVRGGGLPYLARMLASDGAPKQ